MKPRRKDQPRGEVMANGRSRKTNPKGDVPVTIRFPIELHARIKALAEEDMRSFNAEVVWLLDRAATEEEREL
jgi:hypothetical protein